MATYYGSTFMLLLMSQAGWVLGKYYSGLDECDATPHLWEGSMFPRKPITFKQLHESVLDGNSISVPYYEIYALQESHFPPALNKVAIRWRTTNDAKLYLNDVVGWYPLIGSCFPTFVSTFTKAFDVNDYVLFTFNNTLPTPVPYIGTIFSSCPERYIINWYCPLDKYEPGYQCRFGARLNIMVRTPRPDHMPWHMIARDICQNDVPNMDDIRWKHTFEDTQCKGNFIAGRKKREVETTPTLEEIDALGVPRLVWP